MEPSAIIAILTFLIAYGILATEKINRTIIVGAGSLVLLVFGVLDLAEAINYVNWETIGLLLGMFIIVVVLSDSGFFSYLAFVLAKKLNYNPQTMLNRIPTPSRFIGLICRQHHCHAFPGSTHHRDCEDSAN